jgi:hypothetical protein
MYFSALTPPGNVIFFMSYQIEKQISKWWMSIRYLLESGKCPERSSGTYFKTILVTCTATMMSPHPSNADSAGANSYRLCFIPFHFRRQPRSPPTNLVMAILIVYILPEYDFRNQKILLFVTIPAHWAKNWYAYDAFEHYPKPGFNLI